MRLTKGVDELFELIKSDNKYTTITPEVLLYWITKTKEGSDIFSYLNVDIKSLLNDISSGLELKTAENMSSNGIINETPRTKATDQILSDSIAHANQNSSKDFSLLTILNYILETDTDASYALRQHGVTKQTLGAYNHKNEEKNPDESFSANEGNPEMMNLANILETVSVNLTEKAAKGNIEPLIGRDAEIERVIQTLSRRRKNNPLLVGEPGVGKTAIAEGLALRIVNGQVPDSLKEATIYSLDVGSLLAGTKYRGDFEQKLKAIMKKIQETPNAILFIDEIHTIVGAGASGAGNIDASNILKPSLSNGTLKVIGSTTYKEKVNSFDKDAALSRRFQVVDVAEPSIADSLAILRGLKSRYEEHHGVKYTDQALEQAVELSVRYLTDRHLPDKAIDLIDEAGSYQKIQKEPKEIITVSDIENMVAKLAKLPPKEIKGDDKSRIKELKKVLSMRVFGQEQAIESLSNTVMIARSGLGDNGKNKPLGSFMFAGPTGVGKTEIVKQLANQLNVSLIRFDMSEYMEKHAVAKLIGSPPGYVGYDEGGLLTDSVMKKPYSVVLFDEIEKAHPDIYNITLQIMDNGFLTDSKGHKVDFRNTIIIFTTNVGAKVSEQKSIGFVESSERDNQNRKTEIETAFSPEFRNRLDKIINFNKLDKVNIRKVVDKKLLELEVDLKEKKIEVDYTAELRDYLAEVGFDEKMGARPMSRAIQENLSLKLATEMLMGRLEFGGKVSVNYSKESGVTLDVTESFEENKEEYKETITA